MRLMGISMHATGLGKLNVIAIAVALAIGSAVVAPEAQAQAQTVEVRRYDIAAGKLSDGLKQLGMQSGLQLLAPPELTRGLRATPLAGSYTVRQALERVLGDTGLAYEFVNSNTVVIKQGNARAPVDKALPRRKSTPVKSADQPDPTQLETIEVTGSRLARTTLEGPVPVNIYSREQIENSGQLTLVDFLNTLPEVSVGNPENGANQVGQTTVSLRGLPVGATLVLLNGRRLEGGSFTYIQGSYFDLNNIPSGLIERIEIVPQGSSAVYGSDALAGVVNIILRQDYDGVEANLRYGSASGIDEKSVDFGWGKSWERGSVSVIGSVMERGRLNSLERSVASGLQVGTLYDQCNPANVYSLDGTNLPGLSSSSAGLAPGSTGAAALEDFNAGLLNKCRYSYTSDLVPATKRSSVLASASYRITDNVELFTEFMRTSQEQGLSGGHRRLTEVVLPASNAYNPFGVDVRVNYRFNTAGGEYYWKNDVDFTRMLVGARGTFGDTWRWELAAWDARDEVYSSDGGSVVDFANLAAALASSDPTTALNLFTTGPAASDQLLSSIYSPFIYKALGVGQIANGYVAGTLFDLPAGPLEVVLGAEYVRSKLSMEYPPIYTDYNFSYGRTSSSVYGELRAPLIAGNRDSGGADTLAFTAAIRQEHYSDFGDKLVPQYALEWRPHESLLVRASYAEAFKAPGLNFIHFQGGSVPDLCCVFDPQNGGAPTSYTMIQTGNLNLAPETGSSGSAGFVWAPTFAEGLDLGMTWWSITYKDRVSSPNSQEIVDNEALFPGRVVRDPVTGTIESVDVSYVNYGRIEVAGYDVSMSYRLPLGSGTLTPKVSLSRIYKYESALVPGTPAVDQLGKANNYDGWAPKLKAVAGISWNSDLFSLSASGRYVGRYTDYQDLGPTSRQIGGVWTLDLSARYELGKHFFSDNKFLQSAYAVASVVDALNEEPDYSAFFYGSAGYDASQYDVRGRFVSLGLGIKF